MPVTRTSASLLSALMLGTSALVSAEPLCAIDEQNLPGAWRSADDAGFFEEFALLREGDDRQFNSWRHQRPELFGARWALEDCQLQITPQQPEFEPFLFEVRGLKGDELRLYDLEDESEAVYQRVQP